MFVKPNRFNASTIITTKCECSSLGLCLWIIECIESAQDPEKWIHSKSNESIGDEQGCILLECTKFKAENFDAPRISMWQNPNDQKKIICCPSSSNVKEFAQEIFHLSLKLCKRYLMIVYNIQPVQHMTNSIHIRCKTRSLWGQICNFLGSPICSVSGTCYPNPEFLISMVRWTDHLESQSCQNVVART
jgi:hypothetical protein